MDKIQTRGKAEAEEEGNRLDNRRDKLEYNDERQIIIICDYYIVCYIYIMYYINVLINILIYCCDNFHPWIYWLT